MRRFGLAAAVSTLSAMLAALGCAPGDGRGGIGAGIDQEQQAEQQAACATVPTTATERVMQGLKATCEGCHLSGARGYFATVTMFQSLVVTNPRLVSPGKPDESELVLLLEGKGTGGFAQMPPAGPNYAQLVAMGKAKLSIDDVRAWIKGLPAQQRDQGPDPDSPRITRVSAAQIQRSLYQQLGLAQADFFYETNRLGPPELESKNDNSYPIQGADQYPAPFDTGGAPAARFMALGGGSTIKQTRPQPTIAPTFVLNMTQVSQAWCRMALAKANNVALFPAGQTLATDPTAVKATMRRWFMHFLAETATDAQVDAVYQTVFARVAADSGTEPAYTAACSYFIRHPHWTFY